MLLNPPPPPPPRAEIKKIADLEVSCQVGLQKYKCHFTPPPRNENIADLDILCQVGLQISKCHFTPTPLEMKRLQIWKFHVKLELRNQSATLPPL